ncbi:ROK family transcriptional regulator [Kocuria sp.]|jgi:predicted NBD/HSP70 family sugar kinase|uniref:ROK family transcriptional regulator n=1 Tax=Kocuria sp. TaxID=1871328 RepID=UPI0028112209|nr:ROK family transcriptional regulator [Kocuria sp.]HST72518.1 ROK family transcriptional regulator [Kocuria rosea]
MPVQSTDLREHNLSTVLRAVAEADGPVSRAGLAKRSGLTKPTVSKLVQELLDAGLVVEGAQAAGGAAGRPVIPLSLARGGVAGVGLEIAADHVACLVTGLDGEVLHEGSRFGSFVGAPVDAVAGELAHLLDEALAAVAQARVAGVCVSVPGRLSTDRETVLSAPNLAWRAVPLLERLRRLPSFRGALLTAGNDSMLAAGTEVLRRPGESFLFLHGQTGIGGAVVLEGRIHRGEHGWAGELGHVTIEPGGQPCRCGRRGCLEAYVSYHALRGRTGLPEDVRIEDLVEAMARRLHSREAVVEMLGRPLGAVLANAMNVLDLSTVVLSGYFGPIAQELEPVLREVVEAHALTAEAGPVRIEQAAADDRPSLTGAATTALEPIFASPAWWIARG